MNKNYYLILLKKVKRIIININIFLKILNKSGDWGLGIGDWGLGIGPNPQSPIPIPNTFV